MRGLRVPRISFADAPNRRATVVAVAAATSTKKTATGTAIRPTTMVNSVATKSSIRRLYPKTLAPSNSFEN